MSRALKFRVWNGNEMVTDVTTGKFGTFYVNPGAKGDGLDPSDSASLTSFNTIYHSEYNPVMQYTGLKDKNGVEIYESDVVHWVGYGRMGRPAEATYQVEWGEMKDMEFQELSYMGWNVGPQDDLEVIGNIYENPKLLGKAS